MAALLDPFYPDPSSLVLEQLGCYLDLLLKWNARTNLTAIRDPEEIVRRHFGESLFLARHLPEGETLLDLGSGAGFPGIPAQIAFPQLRVTLAESQNKKASFLREVVRTLGLTTEVIDKRAETLVDNRTFDIVALRAVDDPDSALTLAGKLLSTNGHIAHITVRTVDAKEESLLIPGSLTSCIDIYKP